VLRWSDGSTTLQLASQPTVQYDMDGNPLAPPQRNPIKPTPVSVTAPGGKGGRQGDGTIIGETFDQTKDAFTYLVLPYEATETLRVTHKITAGLSIRQNDLETDDAVEKLQAALASAANATKVKGASGLQLQLIDEDPEKKRKQAEEAMRQKMKLDKRREAAAQRELERSNRTLGRHGLSSGRYGGGLNTGFLEDEEGLGGSRRRKTGATPRRARQRRNSIYSDDEDFGRKKFTSKEDEYDEEDDFVAPSDEEEEVEDDDDPDDGIVEERAARDRTPKRDRPPPDDDEADAEGEVDEDVAPTAARKRQRRIVDEDEE
jgi:RNA polymerase-associated protein LEO1